MNSKYFVLILLTHNYFSSNIKERNLLMCMSSLPFFMNSLTKCRKSRVAVVVVLLSYVHSKQLYGHVGMVS